MSHRNARLTFHGRRLLVLRVRSEGMPVAHAARAMGISRQCAHRWVARFDAEGEAGLVDRSSRPHCMPTRTAPEVEALGAPIVAYLERRVAAGHSKRDAIRCLKRFLAREIYLDIQHITTDTAHLDKAA